MDGKEYRSDQLMNALVKATAAAGHQLTFEEALKTEGLPEPNTFAYYWKTYEQAAQAAWRKVQLEKEGAKDNTVVKMSKAAQMMLSRSNH
ncbi:hypothetical protein IKW73_02940 [Candidatus Saccharibacteria bacterium]|nr:hypothetical protein [Candidatus Saccharibacteria bacterium]